MDYIKLGTSTGMFDSDGDSILMGDTVIILSNLSEHEVIVGYKEGKFIDLNTSLPLYDILEECAAYFTQHPNKFLKLSAVKCNFQTFNGLTHKCDLKLSTPKSKDRYPTCDGTECIFIK